jgi:O-antigen/teichoic acid export membrane protein
MHREGKHVLSHTAIYLVARGVPALMGFVAIRLFTEKLSPAEYGRYALVVATVCLLNALIFQWLRLSLVRYLPAHRENPTLLRSTMMTATVILVGFAGVVAAIIACLPIRAEWRGIVLPCWVMLAVQAVFELCGENSRAMLKPGVFMLLQLTRTVGNVLIGLLFVLLGAGWWGPLCGLTIGMAIGCVFALRNDWRGVRWSFDRALLKQLAHYGLPLSITVALAFVISSSDRYIIDRFMGESAVGLYSVAVDFTTQTLITLMLVVYMAMFPLAVRAFEHEGKEAAQHQMRSNASLLLAIGIPCVIGMTMLAPGIAQCFLGKNFRATAAHIIPLVALGSFLYGFKACHFDCAFQFAHRTIYQVWIVLFVAILNFALNWLAIPKYGINGAAGASALAYVISIILTAWLGRRHFALPFPVRPSLQVLSAGGAMALLLLPLRHVREPVAVLASIAGAALIYGSVLLALDFMDLRSLIVRKWGRRAKDDFPVVVVPEAV